MATFLKCLLCLFICAGIAFTVYGLWHISMTVSYINSSVGRAAGRFDGYHREYYETTSFRASPANPGTIQGETSWSVATYPEFSLIEADGQVRTIRESKAHVWERFEPGQTVEIILDSAGNHRLAGVYSLYVRDICIAVLGLGFIFVPLIFWFGMAPALSTPAGAVMTSRFTKLFAEIAATRIGPITAAGLIKGTAIFCAVVVLVSLVSGVMPYFKQMRWGSGGKLIRALEESRFDEARTMIVQGKGIKAVNEFNQNALLLSLEAGQSELARLLIEAGADVSIKSKMYKTPLSVAARAGDLDIVKLLLARKADLDTPEDEVPPVIQALAKGHDEIARLLIEAGSDLQRQYRFADGAYTVGDLALLGQKTALVELIRQKGGRFGR